MSLNLNHFKRKREIASLSDWQRGKRNNSRNILLYALAVEIHFRIVFIGV